MPQTYPRWSWRFNDDGVLSDGAAHTIVFNRYDLFGVPLGDLTATVPAPPVGTYWEILGDGSAQDLLLAVQNALNAADVAGGGPGDFVVNLERQASTISLVSSANDRYGRVWVSSGAKFRLHWSVAHTFPEETLGYNAGVDFVSGVIVGVREYAPKGHQRGWWPREVFAEDRLDRPIARTVRFVATSGLQHGLNFDNTSEVRDVRCEFLMRADIEVAAALAWGRPPFETMWRWLARVERVHFWPDATVVAAEGEFTLRLDDDIEDSTNVYDFQFPTVEFWKVTLRQRRYVAP